MEEPSNGKKRALIGIIMLMLIATAAVTGHWLGRLDGRDQERARHAGEVCEPPGVRADPAAVEAFFRAWNDPVARGAVTQESPAELVLAEAVRLVLYSEQGGFEGFNVYMSKGALSFSQAEIEDIGTKLATGTPDERLAAFRTIVGSDFKNAALVEAVLNDPRISTAPAPPPEPEDPDEEPAGQPAPAPPR